MHVVANGETILSKKNSGEKPRNALERHGREGWYHDEPVTYYVGVGWVSKAERMEAVQKVWPCGTVFASRHSHVPIPEPTILGTLGWMKFPRCKGSTRVILLEGGWERVLCRNVFSR